jgi:hypothetical protein
MFGQAYQITYRRHWKKEKRVDQKGFCRSAVIERLIDGAVQRLSLNDKQGCVDFNSLHVVNKTFGRMNAVTNCKSIIPSVQLVLVGGSVPQGLVRCRKYCLLVPATTVL